jgi:hypothetical protein
MTETQFSPTPHLNKLHRALCSTVSYELEDGDRISFQYAGHGKDALIVRNRQGEMKAEVIMDSHQLKCLLITLLEYYTEGEVIQGEPFEITFEV